MQHSDGTPDLGHGSFLDVVTNMVGILIILVMILGTRLKNAPIVLPADTEMTAVAEELKTHQANETSLYGDIRRMTSQKAVVEANTQLQFEERNVLATAAAAMEHDIGQRRKALDSGSRQQFDLEREIQAASAELTRLEKELVVKTSALEPVEVKCYPTPIGKLVDDNEAHFQIRAGRITPVPLEDLLHKFRSDAEHKAYRLGSQPTLTEIIGPVDGFRMRYMLERSDFVPGEEPGVARGGSIIRLRKWELIPVSEDLGEPLEAALEQGSAFRQSLVGLRPGRTTVTLWTYPDSFGTFRRLKDELLRLGFTTAARPLPEGILIGGSPDGTKSAAE